MRSTEGAAAGRSASPAAPPPALSPRPRLRPTPRIAPRPTHTPTPRFEPRPVIHPAPVEAPPTPLAPEPVRQSKSPIEPPWKILPWHNPPPLPPKIKLFLKPPDVLSKGTVLDVFM